jgi:RNA polymerase sigma-70 factor (ECF subfamily)
VVEAEIDAAPEPDAGAGADEALMAAYAAGDAGAFDALYDRWRGPVFRYFLRQLDRTEAEEAHQDTWLRLVRFRSRYRPDGPFRNLLFTIAHGVLVDRHRSRARQPVADEDPDGTPGDDDVVANLDRTRLAQRLFRAIRRLPSAQREALVLREETGLSAAEIAAVCGGTEEGVRSRLRYAMGRLRAELAGANDEPV